MDTLVFSGRFYKPNIMNWDLAWIWKISRALGLCGANHRFSNGCGPYGVKSRTEWRLKGCELILLWPVKPCNQHSHHERRPILLCLCSQNHSTHARPLVKRGIGWSLAGGSQHRRNRREVWHVIYVQIDATVLLSKLWSRGSLRCSPWGSMREHGFDKFL